MQKQMESQVGSRLYRGFIEEKGGIEKHMEIATLILVQDLGFRAEG